MYLSGIFSYFTATCDSYGRVILNYKCFIYIYIYIYLCVCVYVCVCVCVCVCHRLPVNIEISYRIF
jgi:hypothetical protein